MVMLLGSTKIMEQMYFEDCDYTTYDFASSHSFLLNFCFGRIKCSFYWLSDFLSILPAPSMRQWVWRATPSGNFSDLVQSRPHERLHTTLELGCFRTLSIKSWWMMRLTVLSIFLFYISKNAISTVAEKSCRPDQCPAGLLAVDQTLSDWRPLKITFLHSISLLLLLSLIL